MEGDKLDGPVQEQAARVVMAAGFDVRPENFGIVLGEQRPVERGRTSKEVPDQATLIVPRDQSLRDEPAEAGVIDFAEECSHGVVIARPGVGPKRNLRGTRPSGERLPAPLPVILPVDGGR